MKTLPEQLACARRELALRRSAYPGWVSSGKMKQDASDHEIECMEAIMWTLDKIRMLRETSDEMKAEYRKSNPPKQCLCCGADIDKGTKCENCEEPSPTTLVEADLI
jgi:hypothetical protein